MNVRFSVRTLLIVTLLVAIHFGARTWSVTSGNLPMLSGIPILLGVIAAGLAAWNECAVLRAGVASAVASAGSMLAILLDMRFGLIKQAYAQKRATGISFEFDTQYFFVIPPVYLVIGFFIGCVVGLLLCLVAD